MKAASNTRRIVPYRDGLSAWPPNALAIPMAAESCSGSLKPAAKPNEEHIMIPATVVVNAVNILFMCNSPAVFFAALKTALL
jgi:hypothetical protein